MGLNDEQLAAVNSLDRLILCLACAGAGKSTTMVNRIKRLVDSGVNPHRILALTFTNAAAFEMGEKYKKLPGVHGDIPEFRTFHSFCYSLLIKDKDVREKLGYSKVPEICDDNKFKLIEKTAKMKINCKLSDTQLANPRMLNKDQKFEYDLYMKSLKRTLREENVITFDMLCYNVCELFEKDNPVVQKYKERYQYVHVDEFQDTDPRQFKFIASFPDTTSVFVVGDVLQNIYAWRGCSNQFIKMLVESPDWTVIRLDQNYRSTNQICEFANKMSTYAKPEYRIEMKGQREGDSVTVIRGSHSSFYEPVDAHHLSLLIDKLKGSNEESAVLCRTNKEVQQVCKSLTAANLAFTTSSKSNDVLDILNSSLDNEYMLNWLSTFLDSVEYADYIRLASQESDPDVQWFLTTYGVHKKIKESAKVINDIRTIMSSDLDAVDKFNSITKMLKIKSKCKFDKGANLNNQELVENIRDQIAVLTEANIYVGTVHSSKGLEYESVYVMGVDDGMFKLNTEEMHNLYYVAITRAKNHLTVFKY